jgi:hypothetical protein
MARSRLTDVLWIEIEVACGDYGSIDLTSVQVPARHIKSDKTSGASRIDCHTWTFDVEEMTQPVRQNRTANTNGYVGWSILWISIRHCVIVCILLSLIREYRCVQRGRDDTYPKHKTQRNTRLVHHSSSLT